MNKILRLFAGPNGSGKTTLKDEMLENNLLRELYINPDDIEKQFYLFGKFDCSNFNLKITQSELHDYFINSQLLKMQNKLFEADNFKIENNIVYYTGDSFDSYIASIFSDFIRRQLLLIGESFAF